MCKLSLAILLLAVALGRTGGLDAQERAPAELVALAEKARLAPVAFCSGEFRPGRTEYAVAIASMGSGSRYAILESDATIVALAPFTSKPDLSCYTVSEAQKLNLTIQKSDTIEGQIVPRWRTAVVCGFVDATSAVCWQYSPDSRTFVKVGGWET